jgi:hypothetical protein
LLGAGQVPERPGQLKEQLWHLALLQGALPVMVAPLEP